MRRFLLALTFLACLSPALSRADTIDLDVYSTSLLDRNTMMMKVTTSEKDRQKLMSVKETLIALQNRYDRRVIEYTDLYPLLADYDSRTTGGTLSDQDYAEFLHNAKPTLDVICNNC